MDITKRNFFRLLRIGVFNDSEQIEPMSAWKWYQVFHFATMHGVASLLYDGINRCRNQFFLQIPPSLDDQWKQSTEEFRQNSQQTTRTLTELLSILGGSMQVRPILVHAHASALLYDMPSHRAFGSIDIFYPFITQRMKADRWAVCHGESATGNSHSTMSYRWQDVQVNHLHRIASFSNGKNDNALQNIVEKEFRECTPNTISLNGTTIEFLPPTLQLLHILSGVACHLLMANNMLLLRLCDLGVFLRKEGDKVDYVKLQGWIDQLQLRRVAQLAGHLLVELFAFSKDEIPFMQQKKGSGVTLVVNELFSQHPTQPFSMRQGSSIFVRVTNTSTMKWQLLHSIRYFPYYPSECTTNFIHSLTRFFTDIEE